MVSVSSPSSLATAPSILHVLPSSDPPYKLLQNHPSLILLSKCKDLQNLKQVHSHIIKTGLHHTQFALSKLIEFCAVSPSGDLSYAISVFETMEEPNPLIWNTIIRGHSLSPSPILAIEFYFRMISSGVVPNTYTFPFILKSCAKIYAPREGKQVHAHILKLGLESDPFVHTSLINMYAQNGELESARLVFDQSIHRNVVTYTALVSGYAAKGCLDDARRLFDEMPIRDVVAWNAMIAGYAQCGRYEEAVALFLEIRNEKIIPNESTMVTILSACAHTGNLQLGNWVHSWMEEHGVTTNLRINNALMNMYSKCGELKKACNLFESIDKQRDVVSWNIMIGGYMHMSQYKEALVLFQQMLRSNVSPNDVTLLSILPACAYLGALDIGKWIHTYINKNFQERNWNASLYTSLIDMYSKSGNIDAAEQVFDSMKSKTLASWNAMISGFAIHGNANRGITLFSDMLSEGFKPDDITFVGILSACNHVGLVDLGRKYFHSMTQDYKISPKLQHYGCIIDLLGCSGLFDEAEALIEKMEMKPDAAIWTSLLGACKDHRHIALAEAYAERLFDMDPENHGAYVLLSNIYAAAGRWDDVARIRTKLNDMGIKKVPGCSSIEVDSVVHEFLVGDKVHPLSKQIYKMLDEIDSLLENCGFVPDTSEVLYDMDEEWKEGALSVHSEKLAIAFGLLSTKPERLFG